MLDSPMLIPDDYEWEAEVRMEALRLAVSMYSGTSHTDWSVIQLAKQFEEYLLDHE